MGLSHVARRRAALAASSWRRLLDFGQSGFWVRDVVLREGRGRRGVGEAAARIGTPTLGTSSSKIAWRLAT